MAINLNMDAKTRAAQAHANRVERLVVMLETAQGDIAQALAYLRSDNPDPKFFMQTITPLYNDGLGELVEAADIDAIRYRITGER